MRANRYLEDTVRTAPPQALLLMLYDRLVLDLRTAVEAVITNDRPTARDRIQHAQRIVMELRSTLNLETWPEGAGLAGLYSFIYTELSAAWLSYDAVKTRGVLDLVTPLRDAWREAAQSLTADRPMLTTQVV